MRTARCRNNGRQRLARQVPWDKPAGLHPGAEEGRATSAPRWALRQTGERDVLLGPLRYSAWGPCPCNSAHLLRPESRTAAFPTLSRHKHRSGPRQLRGSPALVRLSLSRALRTKLSLRQGRSHSPPCPGSSSEKSGFVFQASQAFCHQVRFGNKHGNVNGPCPIKPRVVVIQRTRSTHKDTGFARLVRGAPTPAAGTRTRGGGRGRRRAWPAPPTLGRGGLPVTPEAPETTTNRKTREAPRMPQNQEG